MKSVIVVGGGIVGLAVAAEILRRSPGSRLVLLEKEARVALHQTGRNSGVVHSGIYYKPGSLKAELCKRGRLLLHRFCADNGLPFELCGKIVVAAEIDELPRLRSLFERGVAQGLDCRLLDSQALQRLEPYASGVSALYVPEAGRVDFAACATTLQRMVELAGGTIITRANVFRIVESHQEVFVETTAGTFSADLLVNCAGLFSDRVAMAAGLTPDVRVVPFRGEFFRLRPGVEHYCRSLIYPVPAPHLPFLGVHLTRGIDGTVKCGPNAVLALAREGYSWKDVRIGDIVDNLTFPGFVRMARRHWKSGLTEIHRSLSKSEFVSSLQRLVPEVSETDLLPAPAGVRAQAVDSSGRLVDDFVFSRTTKSLHVLNAPSPAATASLAIATFLVDRLME